MIRDNFFEISALTAPAAGRTVGKEERVVELKYKSCPSIENIFLNFNGRIDTHDKCMTLCCENVDHLPGIPFGESAQKSIENFLRERAELVAESVRLSLLGGSDDERKFTVGCANCANFLERDYGSFDGLIHYINLSMYPAPCQCKCVYCDIHDSEISAFNKQRHAESYEKLFDTLDYAQKSRSIAPNAVWQVSSGEISIHPYKDRILDLVKGQTTAFYTNCFLFDEKIAANLKTNPHSVINLSIDSGTPKTWHRVKGVDNFDVVTTNLVKYFNSSTRPGQITLKYIVLPGINDNLEDYTSVIEIMKILQVNHLTIARDTRIKYTLDAQQRQKLTCGAGYLAAMLHKNGMTSDMFTYAPAERELVVAFANELLQTGKV